MKEQGQELIEDLKWMTAPPPPEPFNYTPYIWAAVGIVVLLLAWYFVRQHRRSKHFRLPKVARPHLKALKALKELERLMKEGDDRRFVQEVSDVVRTYIQDRFGIRAPHRSTEEFLQEASQSDQLSVDNQTSLSGFLSQCDLVKFARQSANLDQMKQLLASARQFVSHTASAKTLALRADQAERALQQT